MKTHTSGRRPSFTFFTPAVKHYMTLSVLWLLAGVISLVAVILFVYLAAKGFRGHFYGWGMFFAVDGAFLAATLLGIFWCTRRKKPPTLTAGDARIIGIAFTLVIVFETFLSIGRTLFPWKPDPLLPSLLGSLASLVVFGAAPAYWFWRAKRLRAAETPAGPKESA